MALTKKLAGKIQRFLRKKKPVVNGDYPVVTNEELAQFHQICKDISDAKYERADDETCIIEAHLYSRTTHALHFYMPLPYPHGGLDASQGERDRLQVMAFEAALWNLEQATEAFRQQHNCIDRLLRNSKLQALKTLRVWIERQFRLRDYPVQVADPPPGCLTYSGRHRYGRRVVDYEYNLTEKQFVWDHRLNEFLQTAAVQVAAHDLGADGVDGSGVLKVPYAYYDPQGRHIEITFYGTWRAHVLPAVPEDVLPDEE